MKQTYTIVFSELRGSIHVDIDNGTPATGIKKVDAPTVVVEVMR